jgi:hypothetical protein
MGNEYFAIKCFKALSKRKLRLGRDTARRKIGGLGNEEKINKSIKRQ